MVVAVLYYLFALLSFAGGFWLGIFFLSCLFFVFSLIDVFRYKKRSASIGRPLIVLFISLALMVTSAAAMPSPEQDSLKEQSVATQTQDDQTSRSVGQPDTDVSSQRIDEKQAFLASSQPQPQAVDNGQEKESPIFLVAVQVTEVIDGDTFYARFSDGREEKVRLIGVDTPESTIQHEPYYGKEASNFTRSRLQGRTVYLEKDVSERDKYGRLLRYVWLEKPKSVTESEIRSKMFNAILIINGYAQVATYPPDVKYVDYFTKFQREARQANVGLWGIGYSSTTSSLSGVQGDRIVYWTPGGKSYHFTKNCRTLSRSKTVLEGPLSQCPKSDPCDVCAHY